MKSFIYNSIIFRFFDKLTNRESFSSLLQLVFGEKCVHTLGHRILGLSARSFDGGPLGGKLLAILRSRCLSEHFR